MQILIQTLVPQGKGALLSKEQKENPHRSFLDLGTTGSSGWIVCFGGFPVHWSAAFLGSSYWRPVEALHPAMTVVTTENIHRHCQRPPEQNHSLKEQTHAFYCVKMVLETHMAP